MFWTDREGEAPDKTSYYPSMDYGIDANRTFELHDLLILTDNLEVSQTLLTRQCNRTENQYPCLVKGCYSAEDICDGKNDCDDGFDESDCVDETRVQQERTYRYCYISIVSVPFICFCLRYRMSRYNRYDDYYDNWDGDWGWFDANIDEDREQFVHIPLPETCDDWYLTAFSVSKVSYHLSFIVSPRPI